MLSPQASFAERAISILKGKLNKYMIHNKTRKWIEKLSKVTSGYNNSYNRVIQMRPADVTKSDEATIWERIHLPKPRPVKKEKEAAARSNDPFMYKIGDTVKIASEPSKFSRKYDKTFSDEMFVIVNRQMKQGIPVYQLKDRQGQPILGTFYLAEIAKVAPYRIERIIRKRRRKGVLEALISWKHLGPSHDSWLNVNSIDSYK